MRFLFLVLFALSPLSAWATVRVVATTPDLAAIAREVGGDKVVVTAMALATQDPHFVDARPNLALDLSRADLLLLVGLDLEVGWLPTLITGSRNAKIALGGSGYLDCSTLVQAQDVPTQKVDRSMGDIHPGGNPHYLYDPRNGAKVAAGVATRLSAVDPANAASYAKNAAAFAAKIEAALPGWQTALAGLRGKPVLTYHKSFTYLASWLGFTVPLSVEAKPGVPPSPQHVVMVLGSVKQAGITLILQESYYPATTAELVASKTGARLLRLTMGADFTAGDSYVSHFDALVKQIAAVAK
jgi:zinc/manganese transport system substrate-binding protein